MKVRGSFFGCPGKDIAAGQTRKSAAARERQQGLFCVFIHGLFFDGMVEPAGANGALPQKKAWSGLVTASERH